MITNEERGAKLLDEKYPGWEHEIDVDKLDMYDHCRCILGQLYGSYEKGKGEIFSDFRYCERIHRCEVNGFTISGSRYEWIAQISMRKNKMKEDTYTLALNKDEARTLLGVTKRIAGCPTNSRRRHTNKIRDILLGQGVSYINNKDVLGNITFSETYARYDSLSPGDIFLFDDKRHIVTTKRYGDLYKSVCITSGEEKILGGRTKVFKED